MLSPMNSIDGGLPRKTASWRKTAVTGHQRNHPFESGACTDTRTSARRVVIAHINKVTDRDSEIVWMAEFDESDATVKAASTFSKDIGD